MLACELQTFSVMQVVACLALNTLFLVWPLFRPLNLMDLRHVQILDFKGSGGGGSNTFNFGRDRGIWRGYLKGKKDKRTQQTLP